MAMSSSTSRSKPGDDHIGPVTPDHPDDISEDRFYSPESKRFLGRFGVPEIDGPGKELLGTINTTGG